MKKQRRVIIKNLILIIAVAFASCGRKSEKFINETTGKEEKIEIIRFDKELFAAPQGDLKTFFANLQKKYPEVMAVDLNDARALKMISDFVSDKYVSDAQNIVERTFPDLKFLENDLTSAFANLKKHHKQTVLPKRFFTLMSVPSDFSMGFEERTYTNGDYCYIALDLYSFPAIGKNPYYSQFPQYMTATLSQRYIVPDFMRMYLKNVTYNNAPDMQMNPDATLLDCIIENGKYSYIIAQILPSYTSYEILRYTKEQEQWCQNNEKTIWAYIIQGRLLYEKDRSKFMSLIAEGPTSKPLGDSPARVGNYIGYNIVKKFMDNESIGLDSLMNLNNSQIILEKSKYKPKK